MNIAKKDLAFGRYFIFWLATKPLWRIDSSVLGVTKGGAKLKV